MLATIAFRVVVGGLEPGPDEGDDTPSRIHIFWADAADAVLDPQLDMVMIESKSGFFESVRHGMAGLRAASQEQ